ncbi:MAG: cytochrome c3 family protein [Rhizobiaceae bacterium]
MPGLVALALAAAAISIQPSPRTRRRHHWLGWLAIGAVVLHVVVVTGLHAKFWDWLAPYLPPEIAFGILAALALLSTLALQRSKRLRSYFGPVAMLRLHRPVGYIALGGAAAHVALIAGTPIYIVLLIVAGGIAVFMSSSAHLRDVRILAVVIALAVACMAIVYSAPVSQARLAGLRTTPIDSAGFLHAKHATVTCVTCHHNFLDDTGKENCLNCHKRVSTSETMRIDRMFHAFCGECHRRESRTGERKSGPIDDCSGCHTK